MSRDLAVRRASARGLEEAIEILEEAAAWVAARGEDSWTPGSFRDAEGSGRKAVRAALDAGELFLAWRGGRAVATISLQAADPLYWPASAGDGDARYVHRLAVRRDASGLGIGRFLLRWSEEQTRADGRPFVRLDCPARSPFLRGYYRDAGYAYRGDVTFADFVASLFEKAL